LEANIAIFITIIIIDIIGMIGIGYIYFCV